MKPKIVCQFLLINLVKAYIVSDIFNATNINEDIDSVDDDIDRDNKVNEIKPEKVFEGVYAECLVYMSYVCLQNKTMVYIKELNKLNEVSVLGDYIKFVKVNNSDYEKEADENTTTSKSSEELSLLINKAVDNFFHNHVLKFNFLGRDVTIPQSVEEFAGRKRKGGGGGGGGGGHMHDDGGKKKMMMMAMMCMKMKMMMLMPAMMGMMGMMSFKGMMFSMMSFMVSKMMLLMKILEKKGGGGAGGGGGGGGHDGGWAAAGGGGAWMPAGQDGGGGYDANGQWQSRSIFENVNEKTNTLIHEDKPTIMYVTPTVRYNKYNNRRKPISIVKALSDEVVRVNQEAIKRGETDTKDAKSRKKRGIVDVLQNAYIYWLNKILGNNMKYYPKYPRYKVMQGIKYVYYPISVHKVKSPKELSFTEAPAVNALKQINYEDFNKGEIVETPEVKGEGRSMSMKKLKRLGEAANEAMEENPWK